MRSMEHVALVTGASSGIGEATVRELLAAGFVVYRRARAVLFPSRWQEPFGIVGLEALTLGVPVVAWESGGVRDWHPGDFLVPWGDLPALGDALRGAIGRRAEAPAGFEPEALMGRLVAIYQR